MISLLSSMIISNVFIISFMTKSLKDELLSLGLSIHEAEAYLYLSQHGKCRAGDLIKETGIHRHLIYQALDALTTRRLVTKTTHNGVFHFQITDPIHLRDSIREQGLIADRVIDTLKERERLTEQEIIVYEGEDALRTFSLKNAASLSPGECIHVLGSGGQRFENAMGKQALKAYLQEIDKRQGGVRTLMYKRQTFTPETLALMQRMKNTQIRILPFELTSAANVVFTNKSVAFQIFEYPYSVVEVRNTHLVEAYKNYFQLLWTQTVRIGRGMDALHEAFYGMVDALRPGEEYCVLGGNLGKEYARLSGFFDDYHHYRIQQGVTAKILAQRDAAPDIRQRNRQQGDEEEKISQVKSFQTPFLIPMQINLYRDQAVMILYKEEPIILYFEDKEVYQGFKLYFDEIWNRQSETLTGHQGIIDLCERVLEEGEDIYLIAATGTIIKTHPEYYPLYTKKRAERNIHLYALANENTRSLHLEQLATSHISYLPPAFASPMVIWIFGDYVAHVLWHEPETIFLIHDKRTAEYYRHYYQALAKIAHP